MICCSAQHLSCRLVAHRAAVNGTTPKSAIVAQNDRIILFPYCFFILIYQQFFYLRFFIFFLIVHN